MSYFRKSLLLPSSANTQIEDEMEIVRSRSILLQVINELNLHTKYKVKDGLFYNETTTPPSLLLWIKHPWIEQDI